MSYGWSTRAIIDGKGMTESYCIQNWFSVIGLYVSVVVSVAVVSGCWAQIGAITDREAIKQ